MLENLPKVSDLPLFIALAATPACNGASIELGGTPVEPADIQLDEGGTEADANVLTANQDGQEMGCLPNLISDVNATVTGVYLFNLGYDAANETWIENAGTYMREAELTINGGEAVTELTPSGSNGDFGFRDMDLALEPNINYEFCLKGDPGEVDESTGIEQFVYELWQDGIQVSTEGGEPDLDAIGSEEPFPMYTSPSFTL